MRRLPVVMLSTALLASAVLAQAPKPGVAKKTAAAQSPLPARTTVEAFLRAMFGFNPDARWSVGAIRPSQARGVAEVNFTLSNAKNERGPQALTLYVLPDRRNAVVGAPVPFTNAPATGAPSTAAVETMLKNQFKDASAEWRVEEVKPSRSRGTTEIVAYGRNQQGQQRLRLFLPAGSKMAFYGDMIPFGADPFAQARADLSKAQGTSRGPQNAPVTIVEFSDLQCPACKSAQPTIDKLLLQNPDVRFVFLHFPLEQIHPWAFRAASYADCMGRLHAAGVWKFIDAVYANQADISTRNVDERLKAIAQELGADPDKMAACAAEPNTRARIWAAQQLGKTLEVTGTPTIFIDGRKVPHVMGTPFEMLQAMVDAGKKRAK